MTAQLTPVASDRETFEVKNPATGESVGTFPVHTADDVAERVAKGRAAQVWWAGLGFDGRKKRMNRWVRWLARDCDTLYDIGFRETGKPKADVQFELLAGLEDVRWAAAHAKRVLDEKRVAPGLAMLNFDARVSYEPLGVVGIITPWNAPVYTAFCGLAYGLAAGNAVILKPSELAAATGVYAVESFYKANPDAPEGLVSWITGFGDTGSALCKSGIDKLGFTGSVPTGRRVMAACAENLTPVLLELGGKDATVVAEDADVEAAARSIVWGSMWNSGQACVGVERVYVVEQIRDEFLRTVEQNAKQISVGMEELSDIGPMTVPAQIDLIRRHVTDALDRGRHRPGRRPRVHPAALRPPDRARRRPRGVVGGAGRDVRSGRRHQHRARRRRGGPPGQRDVVRARLVGVLQVTRRRDRRPLARRWHDDQLGADVRRHALAAVRRRGRQRLRPLPR